MQGGGLLEHAVLSILNAILPYGREIPRLGTEEGRERLRQSGVPLDEYVTWNPDSPEMRAREAKRRRDRRITHVVIGVLVAGVAAWFIWAPQGADPFATGLPICVEGVTLPCSIETSRGLMVETVNAEGERITLTADEYDEAVMDSASGADCGFGPQAPC